MNFFRKKIVNVYVDGFNLYHAIEALNEPSLKWVDLRSLSVSLCKEDEELGLVKYFSAYATWKHTSVKRHKAYVTALHEMGVDCILGKFKKRPVNCRKCGNSYTSHEEKETDVNIGIHLVSDALLDKFTRAIVISADTDLHPAIEMARHLTQKEVDMVAPPNRMNSSHRIRPIMELRKSRLRKNLLPHRVVLSDGSHLYRPDEYS